MIICRDCKAEFKTADELLDHYIKTHDTHKIYFSELGKKSNAAQLKKYGKKKLNNMRSQAGKKGAEKRWGKERGKK